MPTYELQTVDGGDSLSEAFAVRRAVFVDEQGVPETIEMDGEDEAATHLVARDVGRDEPVGTARLRFGGDTATAERVAVLRQYRGDGLGHRLMERAEAEARNRGCTRMQLDAQTHVEGFYAGLGYRTVSDDVFHEAGIPHVEMAKKLDAAGPAQQT